MIEKKQFEFDNFLSGVPARDYVFQNTPIEEQLRQAAKMICEAEYVLLGAGAGMSTAAGAVYGGEWFSENFAEFREKYGTGPYMRDMYSAGFYPYPSEEAYWGYWSKQALLAGIDADHTALHKTLLSALEGKKIFLLSTNADAQFEKAGLAKKQIFCTQGDYFHIQCARGCHPQTYNATEMFRQMDAHRKDCVIPKYMVPKCPVCGGRMNMNLRIDEYFVQDEEWYEAEGRFGDFMTEAISSGKKICLIELGVGFNTPTIIRFPFEKLMREYKQMSLIRLNLNEAVVPEGFGDRAVGINADMKQSIEAIARLIPGKPVWKITGIDEADFGCEERMPGEPLMLLITLESDDGSVIRFEAAENWIEAQGLNEGDEWPEDIESEDPKEAGADKQNAWMENYYRALEELEEEQ